MDLPGRRHGTDIPGRHGTDLPGRRHGTEFPGRRHGTDLPGRRHGTDLSGRRHGTELPGRRHGTELPGRRHGTEFPRGRSLLTGEHWGGALALDRVQTLGIDDIDGTWPQLDDDERILFLWGYEPSLGTASGEVPDRFAWRCRMVDVDVDAASQLLPPSAPLLLCTSEAEHQRHLDRVRACHEQLLDGVIYQANLAHCLQVGARSHQEGLAFFLSVRPPPVCAAFVDVEGWGSLISLSPERFIEADLRLHTAQTFPIKGTLPKSADPRLLTSSSKDQAEHVMIVDLLRNDLGKLAVAGGVSVKSLMHLVTTSSVHHLESTIAARLRDDVGVRDLLQACAPGGSITGAPKSSAVEVIADLEAGPRGPYTGVLGLVDKLGRLRSSLLIRTWLRPDQGMGSLHVGGGIVVDSDPESEWQETLDKARTFGPVRLV